jgi:CheY-like chemotaxis protein
VAAVDVDESLLQPIPEVRQGRYVCITVNDAGKGIDPAALPRIFDPFFTTKASGRGTGLGLSIVHGIMKSIDGAVTVHSTPGQGATFTLYFPAQLAATAATPRVAVPAPVHRAAHILYVDDEESLIFLMTRTLERMGHRVTACASPVAALEKFMAGAYDFDLVVSDMAMPSLSGIELAERILAVRPQLPFIITSGFVDAADVERAHAVGVRQMIMKPNTVEELSVALAAILREQDELRTSR